MLALAGMSRLLRAHLRTLLAVVPRFQDGWEELMLVVESSMAGGRHETAVAAVALLSNVLQVAVQSLPYKLLSSVIHLSGCLQQGSKGLPLLCCCPTCCRWPPSARLSLVWALSAQARGCPFALVVVISWLLRPDARGCFSPPVDQGQSLQGCYP